MKSDQSALEMAALLIESGARDELRDLDGRGALFLAVERDGPAGLILALAAAGGKPSQADLNGETPLMAAADENQAWAAAELLLCGADPSARDDEDKTALDIAWESESFETARAIEAFLEGQALDKATPRAPPGGKRAGL